MKPRISIITPTYNRIKELHRLYASLCNQSYQNLEWIIIDDGSTDQTKTFVSEVSRGASFDIKYHYKSNSGKSSSLNVGFGLVTGELVMLMDSDDWFASGGLDSLVEAWESISENDKPKYAGVAGLCLNSDDEDIIGTPYPEDVFDSDFVSIRTRWRTKGDKKELVRADLLHAGMIPEFADEKRVPTSWLWIKIGDRLATRFVNKAVAYKEYQSSGITRNIDRVRFQSPRGSRIGYLMLLRTSRYLPIDQALVCMINYIRYSWIARVKMRNQLMEVNRPLLWLLAALPAWVLYVRDRMKFIPPAGS